MDRLLYIFLKYVIVHTPVNLVIRNEDTAMATRIRFNLESGTRLTEEEATALLHELAETLGYKVIREEQPTQDNQAEVWLTRAQFDQSVTARIDRSYAHRTWHDLCGYKGWDVLQVRCNDCRTILPGSTSEGDHFFGRGDSCGGQYASRCSINAASLTRAYDEGKLISLDLGTAGKKVAPAIKELVEQLRQTCIE